MWSLLTDFQCIFLYIWGFDPCVSAPPDKLHVKDIGVDLHIHKALYAYLSQLGMEFVALIDARFRVFAASTSPLMIFRFYHGMYQNSRHITHLGTIGVSELKFNSASEISFVCLGMLYATRDFMPVDKFQALLYNVIVTNHLVQHGFTESAVVILDQWIQRYVLLCATTNKISRSHGSTRWTS